MTSLDDTIDALNQAYRNAFAFLTALTNVESGDDLPEGATPADLVNSLDDDQRICLIIVLANLLLGEWTARAEQHGQTITDAIRDMALQHAELEQ